MIHRRLAFVMSLILHAPASRLICEFSGRLSYYPKRLFHLTYISWIQFVFAGLCKERLSAYVGYPHYSALVIFIAETIARFSNVHFD